MKKIGTIQEPLRWVQPNVLKMNYELRAGEDLAATLRFRSAFGTLATAETADGCWTFKRVGFLQSRATIRACGSDAELATFENNTWSGGGTLKLSDGRTLRVTSNFWQTQMELQTEAGEVLIRIQTSGLLMTSVAVELTPSGLALPELPWLTMFVWYVTAMMQMDASMGAVVVAAT